MQNVRAAILNSEPFQSFAVNLNPSSQSIYAGSSKMADDGRTNCVLPPSPNWYCSCAADCSLDGAYAFVAKKRVCVLDVSREPPCFKGKFTEHSDRTSAVVFCPHEGHSNLCVSGADDKSIKIWDIETKIVTASHNVHQVSIKFIHLFEKPPLYGNFTAVLVVLPTLV